MSLHDLAAAAQAEEIRRSLIGFTLYTKPDYMAGWFHVELASLLDSFIVEVEDGTRPLWIIEAPVRHGKSELVSRRFPAYVFGKHPDWEIMSGCHTNKLALKMSRWVQRIMDSSRYAEIFPDAQLPAIGRPNRSRRVRTDEYFQLLNHGGSYTGLGVGQSPVGEGANIFLFDDLIKGIQGAYSEATRENTWEWLIADAMSRLEQQSGALYITTRWHEDDPVGRLLEQMEMGGETWRRFRYQAIAEQDEEHRKAGEPLDPARWPLERLEAIRAGYAAKKRLHIWDALYQQNPTPKAANSISAESLKFADELPAPIESVCRGWDNGGTAGGGDYTVGAKLAKLKPNPIAEYIILDVVRGQWSADQREAIKRQTAEADGRACLIEGEQEPGSGGKESAEATKRNLKEFRFRARPATGSKEDRAEPFSIEVNRGNVCILRADWNHVLLGELRSFPASKHDDQVDALALAFNRLATRRTGWSDLYGPDGVLTGRDAAA